jgi:hypothetical protein
MIESVDANWKCPPPPFRAGVLDYATLSKAAGTDIGAATAKADAEARREKQE